MLKTRSLRERLLTVCFSAGLLLVTVVGVVIHYSYTLYVQTTMNEKLYTDINYIEDLLGEGDYDVRDGMLCKGNIAIGNGTEEKANLKPFLYMEGRTGTFSYVFIKCKDEGLEWSGDEKNGYQQGHFLRIAGSTKNPQGESIVGTYIDKK